ncbi:MAG: 4-deoxy-4-formamido-L-arabinose-phosphoundecaprenol deformylase [Desulfobacterales bacterium C00003060]|nr:MAG: 4-deoxy-4-formamido-L-arabinose-phosphoundecaprenol deformylase [Desulfobacterales bacterium S3730MH5]OEU76736.1 MAG: 4-deoxy-4-formamido-L-arabinose-phosphoundecaprenol deformylase [Desulfobacterales bacterium C00003060]OEU78984.1 MAG: 4-deoxy-4-formamido-L-arabinose-phosphoundecaprenol deformylase [Desulfobacterales bacterium S5133MH4]
MRIGLRIDADTLRGTLQGVPRLCEILARYSIQATFYFSVGPDNMGRHLWRLLKPAFLFKMLRSRASKLYGWDILLKGTFLPGPVIGKRAAGAIRATAEAGHEIGLHAWDHHAWQARVEKMDNDEIHTRLAKGFEMLRTIVGEPPATSAVPAWKCTDSVLLQKERFPFKYNSDCRGTCVFFPEVDGKILRQPQIPVTLPTYDEVIGRDGIGNADYNEHILSYVSEDRLNVITIHAEVEGGARSDLFRDFLRKAVSRKLEFVPLSSFLPDTDAIMSGSISPDHIPGREGWLSRQDPVT